MRTAIIMDPILICGTLNGHIALYSMKFRQLHLIRFIAHAHQLHVTAISVCPLNDETQMFASGGYEGIVNVWEAHEREPVCIIDGGNRGIGSLAWDNGAKFLYIERD